MDEQKLTGQMSQYSEVGILFMSEGWREINGERTRRNTNLSENFKYLQAKKMYRLNGNVSIWV